MQLAKPCINSTRPSIATNGLVSLAVKYSAKRLGVSAASPLAVVSSWLRAENPPARNISRLASAKPSERPSVSEFLEL